MQLILKNCNSLKRWRNLCAAVLGTVAIAMPLHAHDISAGNVSVVQNDSADTTASVTVSMDYSVNDLRVRSGSTRGDYFLQVGTTVADDAANGIMMSSIRQNGRDNFATGTKSNAVPMIALNGGGYYVSSSSAIGLAAGQNPEYNINMSAAYFPYGTWLGAHAKNASNGGALITLTGSAGLTLGTHFVDNGGGRSVVNLTSLGIDSRTSGILLVSGGKDESANYALSQPNTADGTWNLFIKDDGQANATGFELDPIAFVFVPKTNTAVVSGRFLGDASIDMYSGNSPEFTVTTLGTGRYELKIPGRSPTNGVLIISAEGGGAINQDNMVSYELNAAKDGWEIQTRDTPGTGIPPLESPDATEGVVSFVYIPRFGITVSGTNNLFTTESGGTATFNVVLDGPPQSSVTINLSSSNTAEGTVSPSSLNFDGSNWNVPQVVTVTGQDDAVVDGTIAYTIVLAPAISSDINYSGLDAADVAVQNSDNDIPSVTVVPTSGLTTTETNGIATFTMRLTQPPSADVTIGLSSDDTTEGTVSPSSVTFTPLNWNQTQTVTVTGVDDFVDDANITYHIVTAPATSADLGYNGLDADDVTVVNTDNDTVGIVVSPTTLKVIEGNTTNYTMVLASEPTSDVTFNIASSDTAQGGTVSPATVTFTPTNWNVIRTVTVTAIDDLVRDGNTAFRVTNTVSSADPLYAAKAPVVVTVTTLDNEALLKLPSGDAFYGVGQTNGVGIDGRATIDDTNSFNYSGITLTIAITNNGSADDRLEIRNTGTAAGQISVSGNTVSYEGNAIGTFSGGTGTTPLVTTFNNIATPTAAQAVLRSVTFRNVNSSPSLNYRSVSATLTRTDNVSTSASTRIRVSLVRATEFQEGADHGYGIYAGEADIALREADPTTPYPAGNNGLFVDSPSIGSHNSWQTMMRFDNILGDGPGQVPTNAVIVSAQLFLHFYDSGGGTPLYRMIKTWDATNDTWFSVGNGLSFDSGPDQDMLSTFDSFIAPLPGGSTGTNELGASSSISVVQDVIAWVNGGEANNGWGLPGWPGKTDGTGISPSEAANIDERPRLRVTWVPAGTLSASFRYGVSNYTGAVDTFVRTSTPDVNYVASSSMFCDWSATATGDNDQLLFRFDNIIGTSSNQIPAGATIHAAMLDVASSASQAQGDGGQFFALLQPWDAATTTWNTWTNGIQTDGVDAALTPTAAAGNATLDPNIQGAYHSFELTPDVQAWVSGTRPNYGWAALPWTNGGDGWGIMSSEASTEQDRPRLRVFYTPNTNVTANIHIGSIARTSSTVTIQFTGTPSTTYSVHRTTSLGVGWAPIGSPTTDGSGNASFTDNAPPAAAAFYRIAP